MKTYLTILILLSAACLPASADDLGLNAENDLASTSINVDHNVPYHTSWHPTTNMIGDGGLLQPRIIVRGSRIFYFQNHVSKVSENNSAIPQDRLSLNYSNLQNVGIGRGGGAPVIDDIQEFRLFAEKTILGGAASLEFLLPIYNTTENDVRTPGEFIVGAQTHGEIGDLAFGIKGLLFDRDHTAVSVGLRVEAPTREDINVFPDVEINDDVWHFTPYIATKWTPNDRLFLNSFISYRLNSDSYDNSSIAGDFKVRESTYLMADASLGYWIRRPQEFRTIRSIASVLELHYTTSPDVETVNQLQGISATGVSLGHTDYLNLTLGLITHLGDHASLSSGVSLPLRSNSVDAFNSFIGATDRNFDWAYLLNLNYSY